MSLFTKCPRCYGQMVRVLASVVAPEHDNCIQCGHYVEIAFVPVMQEILKGTRLEL